MIDFNKNITHLVAGVSLALGVAASSLQAQADETYRYATFVPTTHPLAHEGITPFIERAKAASDAPVNYKLYAGGVLLGAKNVTQGLRDGVADMGQIVFSYYPSEFPYNNFITEMGVYGTYPPAVTAATTEMLLLHCEPCLQEIKHQGVVVLGSATTPPKHLLAKKDLSSLESLKGVKVRTSGAIWDRWLRSVGAVPVAMSSAEQYEALSRGQIDAVMSSEAALMSHGLWDVSKDVTLLSLGMNPSLAGIVAGGSHWKNDLSAEQRKMVLMDAAQSQLEITLGYMSKDHEVYKHAKEEGLRFHQPQQDLKEQIEGFIESEHDTILKKGEEVYKVENPEALMQEYTSLIVKWHNLYKPVEGDKEKMAQLLWDNVYSKIDVNEFGM